MKLWNMPSYEYERGKLSAYTFIRAGEGWNYHQNPMLVQFSDGAILMCWGGYDIQECSNDGVTLYSTSLDGGQTWDPPQVWMASPSAVVSHLQFVQLNGTDNVLMFYREGHYYGAGEDKRTRTFTQWADYGRSPMHLLVKRSSNLGETWDPPQEIDPILVVGVDDPPFYGAPEHLCQLSNSDLLLFVGYLDPAHRHPQHYNISVLRSTDGGATWSKAWDLTVPEPRGAMEPSVAEVAPGQLYGVIRNKGGFIYETRSFDYGQSWEEPRKTGIPTVESMAKVLRLASGRLPLVWNNQSSPTQQPRHPLVAAASEDGGKSWGPAKVLADEVGPNQLSNFNLLRARDGRILLCTSHYRAQPPACSDLDMLVFDEAWLDAP